MGLSATQVWPYALRSWTKPAHQGESVPGPTRVGDARNETGGQVSVRVGYAPGAYDLFHVGHLNILRHAKSHCDRLVAGVVSDEMCELAKGRPPVIPLAERIEIVSHISFVDDVFAETVPDKIETWKQLRFNLLFKGDDWRGTPKGSKLEREFDAVGVEVVYFPYTMHTSSSMLRRVLATIDAGRAGSEATG